MDIAIGLRFGRKGRRLLPALLMLLLPGCIVTPYGVIVPPAPAVKNVTEYEAYRIFERSTDAKGVETVTALLCGTIDKNMENVASRWKGSPEERPAFQHLEFDCLAARVGSQASLQRKGNGWKMLDTQVPYEQRPEAPAVEPGQASYILCRKHGTRLMSLSNRINNPGHVETHVVECKDFVPGDLR